jgi:hypothetical protein
VLRKVLAGKSGHAAAAAAAIAGEFEIEALVPDLVGAFARLLEQRKVDNCRRVGASEHRATLLLECLVRQRDSALLPAVTFGSRDVRPLASSDQPTRLPWNHRFGPASPCFLAVPSWFDKSLSAPVLGIWGSRVCLAGPIHCVTSRSAVLPRVLTRWRQEARTEAGAATVRNSLSLHLAGLTGARKRIMRASPLHRLLSSLGCPLARRRPSIACYDIDGGTHRSERYSGIGSRAFVWTQAGGMQDVGTLGGLPASPTT